MTRQHCYIRPQRAIAPLRPGRLGGLIVALAALLLMPVALAERPLSDAQVRGYIASLEELERFGEQFDELHLDDDELAADADFDAMNPMQAAVEAIRGHQVYGDFERIVRRHGFAGADDWAQAGDRIVRAFMALEMGEEAPEMQREMAQALREIDDNPHLSAEQKEAMRQMVSGAMAGMQAMADAPEGDMEAVRPHLAELRRAMAD